MSREELLNKLHKVHICVTNLVVTYDMGIQFDIITAHGATTNIGNIGSWPIVRFPIDESLRALIKKIQSCIEVGGEDMIADRTCRAITTYHDLFNGSWELEGEQLENVLELIRKELLSIDPSSTELYGYVALEDWDTDVRLFSEESDLQDYVLSIYDGEVDNFDDMSDAELEEWYDKVGKDGEPSLTYLSFSDEE